MEINKQQLDTPINELHPEATNTQTYREFIRQTEGEFGLKQRDLDNLSTDKLNQYLDFLDELWNK